MNPQIFHMSDGPELRAYLAAEALVIERLLELAERCRRTDPGRASQLEVSAARRARELTETREWLDLR